jgi:hypothetical protein
MKSLHILSALPLIQLCAAAKPSSSSSASCSHNNAFQTLLKHSEDASSFCATYLGHSSLSASLILSEDILIAGTATESFGPTETATIFSAFTTTTTTSAVTTSFRSQVPARAASSTLFSIPTPASYVATFPPPQISSACSCLNVPVQNIPVNVNCDGVPTQFVFTDTLTINNAFTVVGGIDTTTISFTFTETVFTSTQTIALPFPTTCPDMALAEYVGTDGSPWFRSCNDSWGAATTFRTAKVKSLDECIDKCVDNNKSAKFAQCIAVELDPTSQICSLLDFVTFPNQAGNDQIAGLKFSQEPFPTLPPGFCENAVSSFVATATPL